MIDYIDSIVCLFPFYFPQLRVGGHNSNHGMGWGVCRLGVSCMRFS